VRFAHCFLKDYSAVLVIPDLYERTYVKDLIDILLLKMGFKQICVQQASPFPISFPVSLKHFISGAIELTRKLSVRLIGILGYDIRGWDLDRLCRERRSRSDKHRLRRRRVGCTGH